MSTLLEIALLGLVVVVVYLGSHAIVIRIERWWGQPLGFWRTALFFCVFLVLALAAFEFIPRMLDGDGGLES
jgi:hypothetical protein